MRARLLPLGRGTITAADSDIISVVIHRYCSLRAVADWWRVVVNFILIQ